MWCEEKDELSRVFWYEYKEHCDYMKYSDQKSIITKRKEWWDVKSIVIWRVLWWGDESVLPVGYISTEICVKECDEYCDKIWGVKYWCDEYYEKMGGVILRCCKESCDTM